MAEITLTREQAEKIYELYNAVEAADTIYKSCQSEYFRNYVRGNYRNDVTAGAFAVLKAKIEASDKTRKTASKSALNKD